MGSNTHEKETRENLYTRRISNSSYIGLLSPIKNYPFKNFTHEILRPRKFACLQ